MAGADNLTVQNNVDGANLTLSGTALLAGKNVGAEAIVASASTGPARVQVATNSTGANAGSTYTVTLANAPASGNTLVAVIGTRAATTGTVTSITQNNVTWTRASEAANSSGTTTEIWYAHVGVGANNVLTINQALIRSAAVVVEYSGLLSTVPVDQTANATGLSAAAATGTTPMTTLGTELWVGGASLVSSGFTVTNYLNSFNWAGNAQSTYFNAGSNAKVYAFDRFASTTGTASSGGTISSSSQWAGAIATFFGVPSLSLGGSAAPNYTLAGLSGTVTVAQTNLTVTAATDSKLFDGTTTAAAVPTVTAGTIQVGDLAPIWTETYDTPAVGTGKTLTPAGVVNDGNSGLNYSYAYIPDFTGVISNNVVYSYTNVVHSLTASGGGTYTLSLIGTPGAQYYLVSSADIRAPMATWTPVVGSTNIASSPNGIWSCVVSNPAPAYYRPVAVNPAP